MAYSSTSATRTGRLLKFEALSTWQIEGWRELLKTDSNLDSALLTPEFAEIVSGERSDTFIALVETGRDVEAVLPVHLRPGGLARPLGAPFSDYSGPIVRPSSDLTLADILRLTGIAAYQSATVITAAASETARAPELDAGVATSHVIRTDPSCDGDLLETQRARHAKRFKNFRRLSHQFEREVGEIEFSWGKPDQATLCDLLEMKSRQFRDSGLVDLSNATQSRKLLQTVAESEYAFLVAVKAGGELVSAHFGVCVDGHFHPWIAAYRPDLSAYSPGNLLLLKVLENWRDMGLDSYDLASGHDHYKKYFSNASRTTRAVFVSGKGFGAKNRNFRNWVWQVLGASSETSFAGRLQRRMDQIAASELSLMPRLREFVYAVRVRTVGK